MTRSALVHAFVALGLAAAAMACSATGGGAPGAAGAPGSSGAGGAGGFDLGGAGGGDAVDAAADGAFDGCRNVDVLFMIDDSGSMGDKQAALAQAFPGFVSTLKAKLANAVSYHVGVVTSDDYFANVGGCRSIGDLVVQTGGPASSGSTCGPFGGHPYLEGTDPDLAAHFACVAQVGAGGSDDERQMRAILNAVEPARNAPGACNAGFARADSLLVVVMITDEDDAADLGCDPLSGPCQQGSGGTSADWYAELVSRRGGLADNIVVLSLVNKSQSCAGSIGAHETGFTLKFHNGVVGDVCTLGGYAQFLTDALPVIGSACTHFQQPK